MLLRFEDIFGVWILIEREFVPFIVSCVVYMLLKYIDQNTFMSYICCMLFMGYRNLSYMLYSQNQELTQPAGDTGQLTTLEKVAVASASSVEDVANQSATNIPWQWHKVQLEGPSSSSSVQLILPGGQHLAKTLLPKSETDTKLSDAGAAAAAAQGQSSSGDVANGGESVESDFSKWKQLQPAVRETLLEKELHRMRSALSEKTQEAQILMQRLERANRIIEQLRQQRRTMLEQDAAAAASSGTDCKTGEPSTD